MGGCGGDDAAAASDGDSLSGTGGDTDSDTGGDSDTGLPTSCSADADCDNGNDCRVGTCGGDGMCTFEPVVSVACRPTIDVEYPPRAATIESDDATVTVVGTVTSPAGPIESFSINGENVDFGDDGSFSHDVPAYTGGNLLILETSDVTGSTRRRVQSFLHSSQYVKPDAFPGGVAEQGLGLYLDQEALDDDAPGQPIDDLASLLNVVLQGLDFTGLFDADEAITSNAGYDIYLVDLTIGSTSVDLDAIDGGVAIQASLVDILGDLDFDCTSTGCALLGGDSSGGMEIDELTVNGNLMITIDGDNAIDVELTNVTADISDLNLYSNNGWTNFLLSIIEPFIVGGIVSDLEAELENQVQDLLGPLLGDTVSGLSLNTSLDLPNLGDPMQSITIDLATDFASADIHDGIQPPSPSPTQGGAFVLRGGAYAQNAVDPYDNLGVPLRNNCGAGGMVVSIPRLSAIEIGLTDDLLNEILYAAWNGGLLQFPFSGIEDSVLVSNVVIDVSGMLAPTASDCGADGRLLTTIGDIRIDASLTLGETPMTFTAFTTLTVELNVTAGDDGIGIGFSGVDQIDTELSVNEDEAIIAEDTLIEVLENALVDTLLEELGGGSLGGIALPVIDLSTQLGLPPGTAAIAIEVTDTERIDGTTLVTGQFTSPPAMP